MGSYRATISWFNSGPDFTGGKYSRAHQWHFEGGQSVNATAAPGIVPAPWSEPANVDPEQAFVAALASCHMLFFLHFAARQALAVESYHDDADGVMGKNDAGKQAIIQVTLRPRITFSGPAVPDPEVLDQLHHAAHEHCFIANSVTTRILIEPR
ncbi:MAG: OsmC family protein [Gammaproteobacteria bacterium]|nr:OsmC family protein [Pseudomonadales bacterium]MCP5345498.1 OsmC family protein [Pseudomonadales bacterium]